MNKSIPLRLVVSILLAFICSGISFSQTKIAELTFEGVPSDLAYTTNYLNGTFFTEFSNGNLNYFTVTDGSNIGPLIVLANQQGFYFGAQNIDDDPDIAGQIPLLLNIDDIDISGYTNLEFRVHLAEDDDGANQDWDNTFSHDYVHFDYDIDNTGTFGNLLWIEATTGILGNQAPQIDTDFNGVGDGTEITDTFAQFNELIPGTGNLIDIRIEFSLNLSQEDIAIDNIEIWGIAPVAQVDWCNIQSPNTSPQNIDLGNNFDVYAQVYEAGLTDPAGQAVGIEAWIGYNTMDNDPEANDATWTWVPAVYNTDGGNNDEYTVEIGSGLTVGTYHYASRFRLNGGPFVYGGTGGIWNNDSVELIVNPYEVDWCNLQYPPTTTINFGDSFDIYGRVYEPGVTDTGGNQGVGISAWIGFSNTDATTTTDFTTSNWTWVLAGYNSVCPDCNDPSNTLESNDEYFIDIGPFIPSSGTYYYVSRFQYNSGPYSYGGYTPPVAPNPSGGGFWDGTTNVSQILTVNSNCTSPQVTYNGGWSATPDMTTEVIIASDCDMTTLASFSACSLTVNAGATLTIDDSKYIEVNNDIIINGNIIVRPNGSVVQNNENATVTGMASVEKNTAILNNWYEYTYWSSPVFGETIETALSDSNPSRRFWFNASNFVDAQMEANNDNNLVPGQDDIDDNGNDWQYASGTMTSGVGYAATHSEIAFIGAGIGYKYTFNGPFNNGIISVPVVRNDTETNDINWNFIGNPYPSAIDVDLFFTENNYDATLNPLGTLEGAIYLWSQNTQPSDTNNGNEGQNFANSDYAIINGTGETPGGDFNTPNRFLPSGQGFFTAFSDNAASTSGNVIFNNSMRVTGNNDQFFRLNNSSQFNKLSIKLTSDNGIFNQMLVGYVDGATDGYDGMFYDAPRNLSTGTSAIIYSTIEGNSRKFAIQGKDPINLNGDEVISIGFKNTIETETQFTISIANLEGDVMNSSSVYLKDNLLNIEHNLTTSNYTFTSDVGEFNERFEIYFSSTLSISEFVSEQNQLIIAANQDDSLSFSTSHQSIISNVQIFDVLGRLLYNVYFYNETTVSINTLTLQNSIFVVNVTLANGKVLTKKVLH